jgi:hypothetical protein
MLKAVTGWLLSPSCTLCTRPAAVRLRVHRRPPLSGGPRSGRRWVRRPLPTRTPRAVDVDPFGDHSGAAGPAGRGVWPLALWAAGTGGDELAATQTGASGHVDLTGSMEGAGVVATPHSPVARCAWLLQHRVQSRGACVVKRRRAPSGPGVDDRLFRFEASEWPGTDVWEAFEAWRQARLEFVEANPHGALGGLLDVLRVNGAERQRIGRLHGRPEAVA